MQGKLYTWLFLETKIFFVDCIDLHVTGWSTIFPMKSNDQESGNDWNIGVWDYSVPTIGNNVDILILAHQMLLIQTQKWIKNLIKSENQEQDEILTIMMNGW